ncbi:Lsr2 family DNA-binding protein [Nocardia xishanensis]
MPLRSKNIDSGRDRGDDWISTRRTRPSGCPCARSRQTRRRGEASRPVATNGPRPGVVREWARANGIVVPSCGRVPADVEAAYE